MERDLVTKGWGEYELLDSGDNQKLELYGSVIVARPETQAIWTPLHPEKWDQAVATFAWSDGKGSWTFKQEVPESWNLAWQDALFSVRLTNFKHTGVFPEQAPNWEWIRDRVTALEKPQVLNLFGYTGVASVVAAKSGAEVTHVDASKQSLTWAKENADGSGVSEGIRYILEDALSFAKREVRRESKYDGIILDPPAFGRGAKGEVWKIEENLPELMHVLKDLLSEKPGSFFLLNGYAAGYTPQSFQQLVQGVLPESTPEFGELRIQESGAERFISSGIYVRFTR